MKSSAQAPRPDGAAVNLGETDLSFSTRLLMLRLCFVRLSGNDDKEGNFRACHFCLRRSGKPFLGENNAIQFSVANLFGLPLPG